MIVIIIIIIIGIVIIHCYYYYYYYYYEIDFVCDFNDRRRNGFGLSGMTGTLFSYLS